MFYCGDGRWVHYPNDKGYRRISHQIQRYWSEAAAKNDIEIFKKNDGGFKYQYFLIALAV